MSNVDKNKNISKTFAETKHRRATQYARGVDRLF